MLASGHYVGKKFQHLTYFGVSYINVVWIIYFRLLLLHKNDWCSVPAQAWFTAMATVILLNAEICHVNMWKIQFFCGMEGKAQNESMFADCHWNEY